MSIKDQYDFKKYKIFDYRINNQLILKWVMANDSIFFFIDINDSNLTFAVIQKNEENFTLTYNNKVPIEGFKNNLISDFDLVKKL